MANNEDKLNRLFREGLEDFAKDPPPKVWSGIKHALLIRKLFTFKFMTSLNIYSVAVFVTIAATAGFIVGKQLHQNNDLITPDKSKIVITKDYTNIKRNIQKIKEQHNIDNQAFKNEIYPINGQQKVNKVKVIDHTASNSIFGKQIQKQNYLSPKDVNGTIKIPEKHVIIDSSKQFTNGINPVVTIQTQSNAINPKEPVQQPSQNITSDEKKNLINEQPPKQPVPANNILPQKKPKTVQGVYTEIFGAPSLLTFTYVQSNINPSLTFVNTSKQDEKPALSYTAGLELGYGLKHVFVQTGLNYSDYRSKTLIDLLTDYGFNQTNLKKDSVFVPDSVSPHYTYHYDTIRSYVIKDTLMSHRTTNSLRYIEIPILLGYRFYGKKMSYAISGGIAIGYLSYSKGTTINPDLKSVSVNSIDAIPFRPWTFYLILRAEAAYMIKKDLSVFIRPGFKYNTNSVFEDYYPVQKSFYTLDLHLGLRYNF